MVSVPPAYAELRALRALDMAQRQVSESVLAHLDRPPWLLTRILARIFDQPMMSFWLFFGVPVGLIGILEGLDLSTWIAKQMHFPAGQELPFWITELLVTAIIFVLVFVPRLFGIYAHRRAFDRARLLAGLQAVPRSQGGLVSCRTCGAPLELAANALVVRCLYCETDNVLSIRTPLLEKTRAIVSEVGHAMQDAAAFDAREHAALRHILFSELRRYAWRTLGLLAPWMLAMWDFERAEKAHETPGWGVAALFVLVFYLIYLMFTSMTSGLDEAAVRDRREANDLPQWIAWFGPLSLWAIVYLAMRMAALLSSSHPLPKP